MRRKKEAVLSFESKVVGLPKVVRDYRARYRNISQVLDAKAEILSAVHTDLLMEPLAGGKFALYAMRYTGKEWVGVLDALTVDECMKAIQDDSWFLLS